MRLVGLSDTHGRHDELEIPDGDVLLFAGDMCRAGTLEEVYRFGSFLRRLPHTHKVVVAGDFDRPFQTDKEHAVKALGAGVDYLQDSGVRIGGLNIYGSPWVPRFQDRAFNFQRGQNLQQKWKKIPNVTDILVTHTPPHGIMDQTFDGRAVGCEELAKSVERLSGLRFHFFGHIHEAWGEFQIANHRFFNCSICSLYQRAASNRPWVVDL